MLLQELYGLIVSKGIEYIKNPESRACLRPHPPRAARSAGVVPHQECC